MSEATVRTDAAHGTPGRPKRPPYRLQVRTLRGWRTLQELWSEALAKQRAADLRDIGAEARVLRRP